MEWLVIFILQNFLFCINEFFQNLGNQDRGGIGELIILIKKAKVPVICTCNDRGSQKIRSLVNYCFDLRVQKPKLEQIRVN